MNDDAYKTIPALAAYIDRIGAEQLNFRRFMVKEYRNHYYIERSLIKINADGSITATRKEHEPTKAEAEAIKEAVLREKWPTAIGATLASVKDLRQRLSGQAFEFWNLERTAVLMVQERIETDAGKAYLPWTYFSDGKWRRLEPDGPLPFWKAPGNTTRIMIHEGAKAAAFCTELIGDPTRIAEHPWGEELREFCHWGMIGGALAPHRADYDEIRRAKSSEVIYVCDNDHEGQTALQEVSRHYGGALRGVRFDKRWPQSWDMADNMPKAFFVGKRFIGPRLARLIGPATFATELVVVPGSKKPVAQIRRPFKEEWFHCVRPEVFVHKDWPNDVMTTQEFNNFVRGFSDLDDTARLLRKDASSKTMELKYDPSKKSGVYSGGDSGRYINTYAGTDVLPEKGDPTPFVEFMRHLVPGDSDRQELMRWCATLIARPDIRMRYAVLLISEVQGVGKGTLGEKILAPLVGHLNVSTPTEKEIVDSQFNYWAAHKRLAIIHEIYAGHSSKAYNNMKGIITDTNMVVSKKYMADYQIDCWLHVFACSNSMRAIQLSNDDRRWFVPKVTEEKQDPQYWTDFNSWLTDEGGLGIIYQWAIDFLKVNRPVDRSAAAPWTTQKDEVISEGYSPGMLLVADFFTRLNEKLEDEAWLEQNTRPEGVNGTWKPGRVIVPDVALVDMITDKIHQGRRSDRLERPLTLRKVAKSKGWYVHPERMPSNSYANGHCKMICSRHGMMDVSARDLIQETRPLDVKKLSDEWFKF